MGTSDGISQEDWDVVHELAVDVVNASEAERPQYRRRVLAHLDRLEAKYGCLPSILATRADYLEKDDPARESLFLHAYSVAGAKGDHKNLVEVAHSLAEMYLDKKRLVDADCWLTRLRDHLIGMNDADYETDYHRLRKVYRKLALSSAARPDPID